MKDNKTEADAMEVNWTDKDPETGVKRFVEATRFARQWQFRVRFKRREDWQRTTKVSRDMWEYLLDALERKYPRSDAAEADLADVRKMIASTPEPIEPRAEFL